MQSDNNQIINQNSKGYSRCRKRTETNYLLTYPLTFHINNLIKILSIIIFDKSSPKCKSIVKDFQILSL